MRNRGSASSRAIRSLALISGLALLATACGNAAETGLEKIIEQQGGGNVDLDFDGDGGFSIQTEEGSLTIDEDGNFTITGEDGEILTGSADAEGNFTIEGEDGTITGSQDDGEFNIESDDGSFTISSGTEMPSEWPSDVPQPDGVQIVSSSVIGTGDELIIGLVGATTLSTPEFIDSYGAVLLTSGFEQTSSFESAGTILRVFSNGTWDVSIGGNDAIEDEQQVTVNLFRSS